MARPEKQGIDYFPKDVDADLDDKLGMIIGEFQSKGEQLYDKLIAWIYKHEGYYIVWEEDALLRFLRRYNYCGFSVSFINEVVPRFIKWGLFDRAVFDTFHILTSKRIQKTWVDATRKRINRKYVPKIWLIEVNGDLKAEETIKKAEETTQSKVKKSTKSTTVQIVPTVANTPNILSVAANAAKPKSFKVLSEKEFYEAIALFKDKHPKELLREFYDYWREKSPSGKMRFQLEDTWELSLRLTRWKKNPIRFEKKEAPVHNLQTLKTISS